MKKIAISFIGTGKYLNFFPKYYETINEYFVPECTKHFFVFTDGDLGENIPENVTVIESQEKFVAKSEDYQPNNWHNLMFNTIGGLSRFDTILKIKDKLSEYDWYVYIDADYYCCPKVINYSEFFNDNKNFFGIQHPTFSSKWKGFNGGDLPFERNPNSLSCVNIEDQLDDVYLQGCIWGGKIPEIFKLINELDLRIKEDLSNNVISRAHDESHLNRYRLDHISKFHVLDPCFAKPGLHLDSEFDFEPRMIHSPANRYEILGA
jgi:hypothetical protein